MASADEFVAIQSQLLAREQEGPQDKVLVRPSVPIGVENSGFWGTFGCFLTKNGRFYALTNSHVVGQVPGAIIAISGGSQVIGMAKSGAIRNPGAGIDAAVVDMSPDVMHSQKNYSLTFPDGTLITGQGKAEVGMEVWFWGAKSGRKRMGTITNINASTTISKTTWGHLIEFESMYPPIGGDSGSVLVDTADRVVGLVFAGGSTTGSACHIGSVLDALDKKYSGTFSFPQ